MGGGSLADRGRAVAEIPLRRGDGCVAEGVAAEGDIQRRGPGPRRNVDGDLGFLVDGQATDLVPTTVAVTGVDGAGVGNVPLGIDGHTPGVTSCAVLGVDAEVNDVARRRVKLVAGRLLGIFEDHNHAGGDLLAHLVVSAVDRDPLEGVIRANDENSLCFSTVLPSEGVSDDGHVGDAVGPGESTKGDRLGGGLDRGAGVHAAVAVLVGATGHAVVQGVFWRDLVGGVFEDDPHLGGGELRVSA